MTQGSRDGCHHPLRKIVVATDFSGASERARDCAVSLAAPGATLTLVHAHLLPLPDWPEPAYVPDWMPAEPSLREEILERLRLFAAPARAAGLRVETALQEGLAADVILAESARIRPDLIALGTHGRRSFERWVMGSVAERVVRLAPAPVLTVAAQGLAPRPRLRQLLCPLDLEGGSETLRFASALARGCGSSLVVLHVVDSGLGHSAPGWLERQARERLAQAVEAAAEGLQAEVVVRVGPPSREILQAALEREVDAIVMGVHDRCQADRGFFGSTADHVVRDARCGVITVRSAVGPRSAATREARTGVVGQKV
jgi:nucleotide-binding universal stress UspA family protein